MLGLTEHMWCRWCGGFGMTDQMVCADSECMTKDMNQGSSLNLNLGSVTINVSEGITSAAGAISGFRFSMDWDTRPEDLFKHLTN
jgi:hypothetical protein